MKVHPALAPFPELGEPEVAALAIELKEHGLVNPLVRCEGMLLDGRARLVACARAKIKPPFVDYSGDPVAFVLRANGGRCMTPGQRAVAAAELYASKVSGETEVSRETRVDRAAQVVDGLGVSRATLFRAVKLLSAGDADAVAKVRAGELALNEAVRALPKRDTKGAPDSTRGAKKYWREPLVDKLKLEIDAIEAKLREACEDALVRMMLQERLNEAARNFYSFAEGNAHAEAGG